LGCIAPIVAVAFALVAMLQLMNIGATGRLNVQFFKFEFGTFVPISLLPLLGSLRHGGHPSISSRTPK
jgi:hypothetical protein